MPNSKQSIAKCTNTEGKNEYLVALACGGVMEDPYLHYENYQIIRADSEYEAVQKYNKLNNCTYYHGSVVSRRQIRLLTFAKFTRESMRNSIAQLVERQTSGRCFSQFLLMLAVTKKKKRRI